MARVNEPQILVGRNRSRARTITKYGFARVNFARASYSCETNIQQRLQENLPRRSTCWSSACLRRRLPPASSIGPFKFVPQLRHAPGAVSFAPREALYQKSPKASGIDRSARTRPAWLARYIKRIWTRNASTRSPSSKVASLRHKRRFVDALLGLLTRPSL